MFTIMSTIKPLLKFNERKLKRARRTLRFIGSIRVSSVSCLGHTLGKESVPTFTTRDDRRLRI